MSNVKESTLAVAIAGEIKLALKSPATQNDIYVLVEGLTDVKVYSQFFQLGVKTKEVGNVRMVEKVLALLNKIPVVGIQDADFKHLGQMKNEMESLFLTDCHDLEMTMLGFDQVRKSIFEKYIPMDPMQTIWENVVEEAMFLAYIKWYNVSTRCNLKFKDLKHVTFVTIGSNGNTLKFDQSALLDALNCISDNKKETISLEIVEQFKNSNLTEDVLNLCNGHDVLILLSIVFKKNVNEQKLLIDLMEAFSLKFFQQTKLHRDLDHWQQQRGVVLLK